MDEAARELYELFKNAPKPKNSGRWGCRQYIPTRRPDGEIDFVFDRSAWAVHLMVGRAIARMLRQQRRGREREHEAALGLPARRGQRVVLSTAAVAVTNTSIAAFRTGAPGPS